MTKKTPGRETQPESWKTEVYKEEKERQILSICRQTKTSVQDEKKNGGEGKGNKKTGSAIATETQK